jgi:alpha-D-ribose 1-methylphosphonate 5-triphosphate diphosphatase
MVLPNEVVHGCLSANEGLIAAIDSGATGTCGAIDLEGDYLLPGLVEIHTDNFERHLMPRPKVQWAEFPALIAHDAEIVAAGITTVFDALGVGEADTESLRGSGWSDALKALDKGESECLLRADHYLHVRCELPAPNTIELFEPFRSHSRLLLISLMDHTPGQRQWEDIEQARIYYTGKKGWSQSKFEIQVERANILQAHYSQPHREYFVDFCQTNGVVLASHDDTTIAHVRQAHAEGAKLSEFPTSIAAACEARQLGLSTVMGGPNVVRGGSHSGNVAAAELGRLGLLDILSSDYVPSSLLSAALRLTRDGIMTLPKAIATVTHNPAQATGFTDRGLIAATMRADLIRVRMMKLADGSTHGIVRAVWRNGQRVL